MRSCTKCNIPKEDTEFSFKNRDRGILHTVCKECQKEYKLKYYYSNKESHYERNKQTKDKIRSYMNSIKSSGCVVCGEKEICCLDFHHTRDKDIEVSTLYYYGSLRKVKEEIEKCIVLCANCHRKVHAGTIVLQD